MFGKDKMPRINENLNEKRSINVGKASFVLSLVGLILFIVGIGLTFINPGIMMIMYYPSAILTEIGLILGAISYFGPYKVNYGLAGFVIAIVAMSLMPVLVAISYSSYAYMSGMLGGI